MTIPVITIDGPSGAGKGTVAQCVANQLGFHLLDSGAVYRAAGLTALEHGADLDDESAVLAVVDALQAQFTPSTTGVRVVIQGVDRTADLRTQAVAEAASRVAVMASVRRSLLDEQRSFRQRPGLVADGRDMGSVVFPDAQLKVFLTASVEERARRRAKQLKDQGIATTMARLLQEIEERDRRDSTRQHAPLVAPQDALVIDSSDRSIDSVVDGILAQFSAADTSTSV